MEIRQSYDCFISTIKFPILVNCHLYIEPGPSSLWGAVYLMKYACGFVDVPLSDLPDSCDIFTYALQGYFTHFCQVAATYFEGQIPIEEIYGYLMLRWGAVTWSELQDISPGLDLDLDSVSSKVCEDIALLVWMTIYGGGSVIKSKTYIQYVQGGRPLGSLSAWVESLLECV